MRVGGLIARPWFADAPPRLRAKTHEAMGGIVYWHGQVYGAHEDYEAALAIWREIGDEREIANAAYNLSFCFTMGDRPGAAARRPRAGRRAARRGARDLPPARRRAGRGERVLGHRHPALLRARQRGRGAGVRVGPGPVPAARRPDPGGVVAAPARAVAAQARRDRRRARSSSPTGLRLFMAAGDVAGVTLGLDDLSAVAVADGDLARARRGCRASPAGPGRARARASRASWRMRSSWRPGRTRASLMAPEDVARYERRGRVAAHRRRRALRAGRGRDRGAAGHPGSSGRARDGPA